MTVISFRAHSRGNCAAGPCAVALIVIAREAMRASAGSRRPSRNLGQAKVLTVIEPLLIVGSKAGSQKVVNRGEDVECEPGARHDDRPAMIVKRKSVSPGFGLIGTACLHASGHDDEADKRVRRKRRVRATMLQLGHGGSLGGSPAAVGLPFGGAFAGELGPTQGQKTPAAALAAVTGPPRSPTPAQPRRW